MTSMEEEIAALKENDTWTIMRRESGSFALHTKWVYKTTTTNDGKLERLKARIVACVNEQVLGVDNGLKFAAVMHVSALNLSPHLQPRVGGAY